MPLHFTCHNYWWAVNIFARTHPQKKYQNSIEYHIGSILSHTCNKNWWIRLSFDLCEMCIIWVCGLSMESYSLKNVNLSVGWWSTRIYMETPIIVVGDMIHHLSNGFILPNELNREEEKILFKTLSRPSIYFFKGLAIERFPNR